MNRREVFSKLFFSSESVKTLLAGDAVHADILPAVENKWHFFPGNAVFLLQQEIVSLSEKFTIDAIVKFPGDTNESANTENSYTGFRLGVKGDPEDMAITANNGINAGITRNGYLLIGDTIGNKPVDETVLTVSVRLALTVIPQNSGKCFAKLKALDKSGNTLATLNTEYETDVWQGAIALVSYGESFVQHTHKYHSTLNRQT